MNFGSAMLFRWKQDSSCFLHLCKETIYWLPLRTRMGSYTSDVKKISLMESI